MPPISGNAKSFLFLQGPAGPFFRRLAAHLAGRGQSVYRINFNGGDKLDWRGGGLDFRARPSQWTAFITDAFVRLGVTDLVLFGDCRPMHRAAIQVAQANQIDVHVFEEGYIRPDWMTLERDGVNAHSRLPRNADFYVEAASALAPAPDAGSHLFTSSFNRRAQEDVRYSLGTLAMLPRFPHFRTHRPWNTWVEYAGWLSMFARRRRARARSEAANIRLRACGSPYFVLPLQLDCDYQIRLHSPFGGLQKVLDHVLDSFAAQADPSALLVIKAHPLDNGLVNWRRRTERAIARRGLQDRVVFLELGDVAELMHNALGVVTVNSTSGTMALARGVPVVVLGQAIYDIPSVTFSGTLDEFWTAPVPPDPAVFDALRRVLIDRCLVRGGLYSEPALQRLIEGATDRLMTARPAHAPVAQGVGARPQTYGLGVAAS